MTDSRTAGDGRESRLPRLGGHDPSDRICRMLADHTYDVVLVTDPDAVVLWASPSTQRILGYDPAALIGSVPDLIHPDDRETASALLHHALRQRSDNLRQRVRVADADGSWLWMDAAVELVWADGGDRLAYGITSLRDITAYVRMEQALADSEARTRLVLENANDAIVCAAPDGTILWASRSFPALVGYPDADVVGRAFELLPAGKQHFAREQFEAVIRQPPDDLLDERYAFTRPDGTEVWVDNTTRFVRDADGAVQLAVSSLRDVTALVRGSQAEAAAQAALETSEALFRTAMENAAIGMFLVTPDGAILEVNDALCRFFGWPADVLRTKTWQELTHPEDLAKDLQHRDAMVAGLENGYRTTKRYLHADGTVRIGDLSVTPIRDPGGQVVRFVSQIVDVTERHRVHEELRRSQLLLAQREAEFRQIAENAADVVVRLAPNGSLTWISPSARDVLGWQVSESGEAIPEHPPTPARPPTPELVERPAAPSDLSTSSGIGSTSSGGGSPEQVTGRRLEGFAHPDDVAHVRDTLTTMTPGVPVRVIARLRSGDGRFRWFSLIATLVADEEGTPVSAVVGLRDIDNEMHATQALARSEEQFRLAMASAPGGMAVVDLDRRFVQVNDALVDLVGRNRDWLLDHGVADLVAPDDGDLDAQMEARILAGRTPVSVQEKRLVRADGSIVWVQHSVGLVRDETGEPLSYVSQFIDITDSHQTRVALRHAATHDSLTRLCNRRGLKLAMQRQLAHGPRTGTLVGVLALDVDQLKPVNDSYGHPAGDEVLIAVADRIRELVRDDDTVARIGGDEFIVTLAAIHDLEDAARIAEKIRAAVTAPIVVHSEDGRHVVTVTTSVGAVLATPGERVKDLLTRADRAMYRAKAAGRDRVHVDADLPV